jgi:Ser/Thr protein kinase RdoA (MazF antagonist)
MIENGQQLLKERALISKSVDEVVKNIEDNYDIGSISCFEPVLEGYEDANFILTSTKGKYVAKFFHFERKPANIDSYIRVLQEAGEIGVPVTQIVKSKTDWDAKIDDSRYLITKFFDGENFVSKVPTIEDIKVITQYLSLLNTLNFEVVESYDGWGNANLIKEWAENDQAISENSKTLLSPVVDEIRALDFSNTSKGVIHADMQRKHVFKNKFGEYCLLDFGCMRYDSLVYEISIFLAWFCLSDKNWNLRDEIFDVVLKEYGNVHKMSVNEISLIKPLIRASYGAYILATDRLIGAGDTSAETKEWHENAKHMLQLTKEWA